MDSPSRTLLVATDLSPLGNTAVAPAFRLAAHEGARVVLATVLEAGLPSPLYAHYRPTLSAEELHKLHERARAELEALVPPEHREVPHEVRIARGLPADMLCELADEVQATLIVLTSHGYSGVKRFLLGSVAESIVRHAPCSVLVLRTAHAGGKGAGPEESVVVL